MSVEWEQLVHEGWHVKEEMQETILADAHEQQVSLKQCLLNTDLRKYGQCQLPDNINRADSLALKGAHVLQVTSLEDVSKPSKGVGTSTYRLLRLKLTDGKLSCIAAEFKPAPQLSEDLPPGTKVCLTNASVKLGVMLLDAKCIQVLGGHVEELVEAWTFQRKFGNAQRGASSSEDTEQPPAFQNFIPGRRHNQAGHRAPAQQAGFPRTDPTDTAQSSHLAISANQGVPIQAALGTAGRYGQPSTSISAVKPPPGLGLPRQSVGAGSVLQHNGATDHTANGQAMQTQGSGRDAAGAAEGQGSEQQPQQRRPQEPVGQAQHNKAAVKQKLLERLADDGGRDRGRGRGRGRGRQGRRGYDDEEESGMTLDEYEAMQRRPKSATSPAAPAQPIGADIDPDEAFAKQLQQQLDMEDGYYQHHQEAAAAPAQPAAPYRTPATSVAQDLAHSLFAFDRQQEDEGDHRRGRGRGRGGRRGDRGRGRRVHHNVQHVPLS